MIIPLITSFRISWHHRSQFPNEWMNGVYMDGIMLAKLVSETSALKGVHEIPISKFSIICLHAMRICKDFVTQCNIRWLSYPFIELRFRKTICMFSSHLAEFSSKAGLVHMNRLYTHTHTHTHTHLTWSVNERITLWINVVDFYLGIVWGGSQEFPGSGYCCRWMHLKASNSPSASTWRSGLTWMCESSQ